MIEGLHNEQIDVLQDSREAHYLKAKLDPIIQKLEAAYLHALKVQFRSLEMDEVKMRTSVGMLCAIEDFQSLLVQSILKGESILENFEPGNIKGENHESKSSSHRGASAPESESETYSPKWTERGIDITSVDPYA